MSANRYLRHLYILPEDDANNDLINGFRDVIPTKQIQALRAAGGWRMVIELFSSVHAVEMRRFPERLMLLLIDFDEDAGRLDGVNDVIPNDLRDRVFVLGVWSEPERIVGSRENLGSILATECLENRREQWRQPLLRHNEPELNRLCEAIGPILIR